MLNKTELKLDIDRATGFALMAYKIVSMTMIIDLHPMLSAMDAALKQK